MDRDMALLINSSIGTINSKLELIVTGIDNIPDSNRSIPAGDQRSIQTENLENQEIPVEEPETKNKK